MTAIAKLDPRYAISLNGFDRRGAAASINHATATGFTVSGCWSDQADFAVLYLWNADDLYGHLFTSRYLPDFSLAYVTLDFDLAISGVMNPASSKYQSVAWGALSYITSGETFGTVALPAPTSTTGGAAATASFTVAGTPATYDRVQLVYLGNTIFDYIYNPSGTGAATLDFYFNDIQESTHSLTIGPVGGQHTYNYTQLVGDTFAEVAAGMIAAVNTGADPYAVASSGGAGVVILTSKGTGGDDAPCTTTEPGAQTGTVGNSSVGTASFDFYNSYGVVPAVTFGFFNSYGTGYSHYITIGTNTYTHVQLATDGSGDIATALAALINAASGDPNAVASASANNVTLTAIVGTGTTCGASDGNASGVALGGYAHFINAAGAYNYVHYQLATDGSGDIATALAALVNAGSGNPYVVAAAAGNVVTLSAQPGLVGADCTASDGNGPGVVSITQETCTLAFSIALGAGNTHYVEIGAAVYTYLQRAGDNNLAITTALAASINASDPNATAATSGGSGLVLTPKLLTVYSEAVVASDGPAQGGVLLESGSRGAVAGQLVTQINASGLLSAVQSGSTFAVSTAPGRDGNGIELLALYNWPSGASAGAQLYPTGSGSTASGQTAKLTGGADPTSLHYHLDFSGLGLASCRQIWLTLAPWLTYDSGAATPSLVAFAPTEFSAVFSNWTVADTAGVTQLKIAGPGSVTIGSRDAWASYVGAGWTEAAGFYFQGFARQSSNAGDVVTVAYSCQSTHHVYLGTALGRAGGEFSVSVDGAAAATVNTYALEVAAFAGRRSIATNVPAGVHVVTLTVVSGTCLFDYLQAAVPSDPVAPGATHPHLNGACDYDTDQSYKIPPARLLWILGQLGFQGDIDFYSGVFFGLKRVRNGGDFHRATVTIAGPIGTGTGKGDGDAYFFTIGATNLGAAAYPADTLATLAQRLVDAINATFVGVCAASGSTAGQFTVTSLTPINGFAMTVTAAVGSTGTIAMTGDVGIGNEGTWAVDASQASPLNRAFRDYLADFAGLVKAAGQTMTVAFSQELLAPPDANTAGGGWAQRFADGTTVLTDTGFGSWGAGVVEAVAAGVYQQTGHGYITGNTAHFASATASGEWAVAVTDANHYTLGSEIANSGGYLPAAGDGVLIDLQTSQCTFNPGTVTAYLAKCYVQAANILAAAGLVPWLQFGEVGWWFYSERMSQAVGYASFTSPISIGTVAPHGFATGQTAIQAGIKGNTAANGTWPIVVTDTTHYTLTGSSGNGTYEAGTGTASGGGMAYYDAWAQASALTGLGRALASFWTQDDDPTVNGGADAWWLAGAIATHIATITSAVLAAQSGAQFELLYPQDVNAAACYYTDDLPYPQGGRLNAAVNFPVAYRAQSGSGLNRLKMEGLSWGSRYRNLTNARTAIGFPTGAPCTWPAAAVAYLVPIFNGGCPWPAEYLAAIEAGVSTVNVWAVDHLVLLDWPVPARVEASFGVVE
jgi:hypothetical protein